MITRLLIALLLTTAAVGAASSSVAEARAGGGRSSGRSSGFSRSAPPPAYNQPAPRSAQPQPGLGQTPPMAPQRGGFMRSFGPALAGGFLGSMLFSSLGHGMGGGVGGGGGGIGLIEIALFAGLAYLGFRWWRGRQQTPAYGTAQRHVAAPLRTVDAGYDEPTRQPPPLAQFLAIGRDQAQDLFFKVQGAWTRRDLTPVRNLLGSEMAATMQQDIDALKSARRVNRLENISVRDVTVSEPWEEGGEVLTTARFTANLLDYTVDEASGRVVEGSDVEPVKFNEDWTFGRSRDGTDWRLVGIEQLS